MRVVVTGATGLLGWHACVRLHARNCTACFKGEPEPFDIIRVDHPRFDNPERLREAVAGANAILHFAGVNRAPDDEIERANPAIAAALVAACRDAGASPHIVHANSIHTGRDTPYGRSKCRAAETLASGPGRFTDLTLPHIFGEGARPNYNNVTGTFIDQIVRGESPTVDSHGEVHLLHAGAAVEAAIGAALGNPQAAPASRPTAVPDLLEKLNTFHSNYEDGLFPDLSDPFDLALFNSYRSALYPSAFPRPLRVHSDDRGVLFETVKGGGGGQTFLSWTEPGVTRGDHFHLGKVERFLVLEGEAVIRIRKVLSDSIWTYRVTGAAPAVVDMPTMHTHSIENIGAHPLLTLFWTHDLFDPEAPDTYADRVIEACP